MRSRVQASSVPSSHPVRPRIPHRQGWSRPCHAILRVRSQERRSRAQILALVEGVAARAVAAGVAAGEAALAAQEAVAAGAVVAMEVVASDADRGNV